MKFAALWNRSPETCSLSEPQKLSAGNSWRDFLTSEEQSQSVGRSSCWQRKTVTTKCFWLVLATKKSRACFGKSMPALKY